jgi:hypothetical protein
MNVGHVSHGVVERLRVLQRWRAATRWPQHCRHGAAARNIVARSIVKHL